MSLTHGVLTATLCNESKRRRISVPSLDQRPLKLLKNRSGLPSGPSKPLLFRLASPLTSARDRHLRRQRRSQDSHSWAGQACTAAHQASSTGLHLSALASAAIGRQNTDDVLTSSALSPLLVGPVDNTSPVGLRQLGIRRWWSTLSGITNQGATQHMASKTLAAVRWALPNLPRPVSRSVGHRLLRRRSAWSPGIVSSTRAEGFQYCRWLDGPRNTTKNSWVSTFVCSSKRATVGRTGIARLPVTSADQTNPRKQASTTPSYRWTWHAINFCLPYCRCSQQPEAHNSSSSPFFIRASGPKAGRRARATPFVSDCESRHMPFAKTAQSTREARKKFRNAEVGRVSPVFDDTKSMHASGCQRLKSRQASPTRTNTREGPGTTLEKALTRALTGATLSIGRVFLSIFLTLDSLVRPQKRWDGLRRAASWVGTPSLDDVSRHSQVLPVGSLLACLCCARNSCRLTQPL